MHVWDIMAQLPGLDDLSLSRPLTPASKGVLPGIGANLGGRFGGRLLLSGEYNYKVVMSMLLEAPSGLRFTEMQISCTRDCLPLGVMLVEARAKTLVSYHTDTFHGKSHLFSQSIGSSARDVDADAVSHGMQMAAGILNGHSTLEVPKPSRKWTLASVSVSRRGAYPGRRTERGVG